MIAARVAGGNAHRLHAVCIHGGHLRPTRRTRSDVLECSHAPAQHGDVWIWRLSAFAQAQAKAHEFGGYAHFSCAAGASGTEVAIYSIPRGTLMDLKLGGKVALVTGSSRGIGRGIALAFAEEGCDLLITGRDARALEDVAQSIRGKGCKVAVRALDLRDPSAAGTLVEAVRREFGGLDILINNAGATKRGDFLALTDADWEDGYALKFFAHVRLARAAWPLLKERRGALVAIG